MFRTNKEPDLQEKSASGTVATFNTALAMPLASCNIAVNAWQEGSGDPSPSNVRPIHGFSEVNVTSNNVVHTIQLGEEVYGAEVDVVNGVAHVTHGLAEFDGSSDENWRFVQSSGAFYININDMAVVTAYEGAANWLKTITNVGQLGILFGANNDSIYLGKLMNNIPEITDISTLKTYLSEHNLVVKYPLATPFDIQLTPTQIETLIGNNTIFADTGNVDLTYKDLDIAKRGNFREVFKLPS